MIELLQYTVDGKKTYMDPETRTMLWRVISGQTIYFDIIWFDNEHSVVVVERCADSIGLDACINLLTKKFPFKLKLKKYIPYDNLIIPDWKKDLPSWY